MILFSFTSLPSLVRTKEVAESRELEALGHREISFPESQPVLSALFLLSVVITCWAALHFKHCT